VAGEGARFEQPEGGVGAQPRAVGDARVDVHATEQAAEARAAEEARVDAGGDCVGPGSGRATDPASACTRTLVTPVRPDPLSSARTCTLVARHRTGPGNSAPGPLGAARVAP
jgi:hypothetical protein